MKNSLKLIFISMVGFCLSVKAQDAADLPGLVFDLTRINNGGSARVLGLGGAQTAIGGDISSASTNPAGLGFFNRSEFSFSTQFNGVNSSSTYLGTTTDASKLNINIPNLGGVIKSGRSRGKWKGQSFGISLNRMADFQRSAEYVGNTFAELFPADPNVRFNNGTAIDFFESALFDTELNGTNVQFFSDLAELAFDIGVTDTFRIDNTNELIVDRNVYIEGTDIPAVPDEEFPSLHQETIDVTGASSQFNISYGANYDDKLYLGVGLGIANFSKDVERIFTERPTETDLSELRVTDVFEQNGIGINGTFGVIVRPVNPLLLGLTYTTPTYYSVSQTRELDLSAQFTDGQFFTSGFTFVEFDYNITTPARMRGGATFFFNKNGFITTEVEYADFSGGRLSGADDGISFGEENQDINRFNQTLNYRVGAEYRYDIFRIRGGFALLGDGIDNDVDEEEQHISFGAGIRKKEFYLDLAVVSVNGPESLVGPYPYSQLATIENDNTRVTVTVGFTF